MNTKISKEEANLIPSEKDFWFLPLGGANEIGMNLNVFGHNGQWLLVDLGVTFNDRYGIEIITPDPSFLVQHKEQIIGLVVTHAHEDHIGAIPYLWPYLRCPIYATPFTMEIIINKIADKPWKDDVVLCEMPLSSTFQVGAFEVEYVTLTHSIIEPNALRITTPLGTILHSGDWKLDNDPLVGETTNANRLIEIGNAGVRALICDSTNVFKDGYAGSERDVRTELKRVMEQYPNNRLTVGCFSSNIARVETVVKCAHELGRKVALVGKSLHRMINAARSCGYLKDLPTLISDDEAMKLPHHQVCFIATGSQGEARAALYRIAGNTHPTVELNDNDVVIFSSRIIPGNEKNISQLQNMLIHQGIRVITSSEEDIHVSGHPARDELKQMYDWVRPEVLVPVHGDARHLEEHARYGLEVGIPTVVVPENGSVIQLTKDEVSEIDFVTNGRWGYDGSRMIPMTSVILRDRQKLANEGTVFASFTLNKKKRLSTDIYLSLKGVCDTRQEMDTLKSHIVGVIESHLTDEFNVDEKFERKIELAIRKCTQRLIGKKPLVQTHILQDF